MPLDYNEFAEKIKQKYPEYKDVDNYTLTTKMIEKYPEYKTQVVLKKKEVSQSTLGQSNTSSDRLSNTTTKPTASSSSPEILTDYLGKSKKKYKFEDNQWYEENPNAQVAKSTPSKFGGTAKTYGQELKYNPNAAQGSWKPIEDETRIKSLNYYYKKDGSLSNEEKVFTNYDAQKKDNLYRINNGQWERKVPKGYFAPVNDETATKALNKRYGQNVVFTPTVAPVVKKEDPKFTDINSNLTAKTEENAISYLEKNYGNYGFEFNQEGLFLVDQIRVKTRDGKKEEVFEFDEKNPEEAARLRAFLEENKSKAYSKTYNYLDEKVRSQVTGIPRGEGRTPQEIQEYLKAAQIKKGLYILSDDYLNNFKKLDADEMKDQITNVIGKSGLDAQTIQDFYKTDAYKAYKTKKADLNKAENERLNSYYDELKYARVAKDKAKEKDAQNKIDAYLTNDVIADNVKNYDMQLNDLKNRNKQLETEYSDYEKQVNKFNSEKAIIDQKVKSGEISREQYNGMVEGLNDRADQLNDLSENIQTKAQKIKLETDNVSTSQKKLNYVTGKYVAAKEKEGGAIGFAVNSILNGVSGAFIEPFANYAAIGNQYEDLSPEEKQYYKDKKYTKDQVENILDNKAILKAKNQAKEMLISSVGFEETTQEYMKSGDRGFIATALGGVLQSLPAMATGVLGKAASFTSLAAQAYSGIEEEMLTDPDFQTTSVGERSIISIPYAIGMGVLENAGLTNMIKSNSVTGKALQGLVAKVIEKAPKGATQDIINKLVTKEIESNLAKGVIKITQAGLAEFETGATQSLVLDQGLKQLYNIYAQRKMSADEKNNLSKGEFFDTADSFGELATQTFEDGLAEMIGGVTLGAVGTLSQRILKGNVSIYNADDVEFLKNVAGDDNFKKLFVANLKTSMLNGSMTKGQAQDKLDALNEIQAVFTKLPEDISKDQVKQAMDLVVEKTKLEKETAGKDPALVAAQNERINAINEELKTISQNAVQEQTTSEVSVQPGAEVGGEVAKGESKAGSQVIAEEVSKAKEEVDQYIADAGSEARIGSAINPLVEKMAAAENIDDADIDSAIETIFNEVDSLEKSDQYSPETKKAISEKLLNIADKLDNYEFRTTTETVATTKAGAATTTRKTSEAVQKINAERYFNGVTANVNGQEVTFTDNKGRVEATMPNGEVVVLDTPTISVVEDGFEFDENGALEAVTVTDRLGNKVRFTGDTALDLAIRDRENKLGVVEQAEFETAYQEVKKNYVKEAPIAPAVETTSPQVETTTEVVTEEKTVEAEPTTKAPVSQTENELTERNARTMSVKYKRNPIVRAAINVLKALPGVKIYLHENADQYSSALANKTGESKQTIQSEKSAGSYIDGEIHLDMSKADLVTLLHEAFHHAVMVNGIKGNYIIDMAKGLRGIIKDKDRLAELDAFIEQYEGETDQETLETRADEFVAQLGGILAANQEELTTTGLTKFMALINRIFKNLGLGNVFTKASTSQDAVNFINAITRGLNVGEDVSGSYDPNTGKLKFQADFSDPLSKLTFVYDKNKDDFKKLEKDGYITYDNTIADFAGKYMFLHQPDAAFSGMIYKNGELLVEGKGGVYYPIKFHKDGYFWASTSNTAKKMAEDLNKVLEQNGGTIYMALTSAPSDKLMSSTTMSNAILDFFSSKAFDKNFKISQAQLKQALITAANDTKQKRTVNKETGKASIKNVGLNLGIKPSASISTIQSLIKSKLNPDNSSFGDRKNFAEELIKLMSDDIKNNPDAVNQFGKLFSEGIQNKYFKGVTKTGKLSISKANMVQAISEMFTEPLLKEGVNRESGGQVYAVIELNGPVKPVDSDKHESYPKAIQSDSDAKVIMHILQDRRRWSDVFEDFENDSDITKERETKIFPTSGVSVRGLRVKSSVITAPTKTTPASKRKKQIIGKNAELSDNTRRNLELAKAIEMTGVDQNTIFVETGWFRGTDGKWKYEVPDELTFMRFAMSELKTKLKEGMMAEVSANQIIGKNLLLAYPQLSDITFEFTRSEGRNYYNPFDNVIRLSIDETNDEIYSTYVHEVQHAIQHIENFAKGGGKDTAGSTEKGIKATDRLNNATENAALKNPKLSRLNIKTASDYVSLLVEELFEDMPASWRRENGYSGNISTVDRVKKFINSGKDTFLQDNASVIELIDAAVYHHEVTGYKGYLKLGGEVESRNVEKRLKMGQEERKSTVPNSTEDVAAEDQILYFDKEKMESIRKKQLVYHGGDVVNESDLKNNEPLYVSKDKKQAELYAKDNKGKVVEFDIDETKLADEEVAFDLIKELGLKAGEGWNIDELNLFELIDSRFETSMSESDTKKLFNELSSRGYNGIKFMDTNLETLKQDIENYVIIDPKKTIFSKRKKQLTTDKDAMPGSEAALEALGETEAQREAWKKENKVNQKQKRNPIVEQAAKDYFNEEINQEEYLDTVAKNQPIKLFKNVPRLPSLKEIVNSLKDNQVATGIIGLTKNLVDGARVACRLDIPAYEWFDTWVVSIHDGVKEGKSIAYGQTAVLKNVDFKTFPGTAMRIATGSQKTTIARMFGDWVNEDPEAVHARAEELMNDPAWTQVGMNPFRYSWFYDKADGMPVVSADEVIQVGALVLAKNVKKVLPSDPMFETKSAKGGKIKFQKAPKILGQKPTVVIVNDEAKALIDQIKLEVRAQREQKKAHTEVRKSISDSVKALVKKGSINLKQASTVISTLNRVNLDNPEMVKRFNDYVAKVFDKAEYIDKVEQATRMKKKIKANLKGSSNPFAIAAKGFSQLDPKWVENIDDYIMIAQAVYDSVKKSAVRKGVINWKQEADFQMVAEYVFDEEARQTEMLLGNLRSLYERITGESSDGVAADVMQAELKDLKVPEDFSADVLDQIEEKLAEFEQMVEDTDPEIVKKAASIDPTIIPTKEAIRILDALDTYFTNGSTAGLDDLMNIYIGKENAIKFKYKGKPLRSFGSKLLAQTKFKQLTQFNMILERKFRTKEAALAYKKASGIQGIENGANKAEAQAMRKQREYLSKFGKIKGFNSAENIFQRGALANLLRTMVASEELQQAEFDRNITILRNSVDTLSKGNANDQKKAKVYKKVLTELGVFRSDVDIDMILKNSKKENIAAVNFVIDMFGEIVDPLSDLALGMYNQILTQDVNYTPYVYKMTDLKKTFGSNQDNSTMDFFGVSNYANQTFDKNKAGVLMPITRPKTLQKGMHIDLDFDNNMFRQYRNALVDLYTAGPIRQFEGFFNSEENEKILGSNEDQEIIKSAMIDYVRTKKGSNFITDDGLGFLNKLSDYMAQFGAARALVGIGQFVNQFSSGMTNTIVNAGEYIRPGDFSKDVFEFIANSGRSIANVGGDEILVAMGDIDKSIERADLGNRPDQYVLKFIAKENMRLFNVLVAYPDSIARKLAWMAYYRKSMVEQGLLGFTESVDTTKLNDTAADYAQLMVDRNMDATDATLRGSLFRNRNASVKILRSIFMPFASFGINQKNRMWNDLNSLASGKDKVTSARSIVSIAGELVVYNAIRYYIAKTILGAALSLLGYDDDDQEELYNKLLNNAKLSSFSKLFTDIISPLPLLDNQTLNLANKAMKGSSLFAADSEAVQKYVDKLKAKGNLTDEEIEEKKKAFEEKNARSFYVDTEANIGTLGIQYEKAIELMDLVSAWRTGEYVDDNNNERFLSKDSQEKLTAPLMMKFIATVYGTRELDQIANKSFKLVKDAESMSKTQQKNFDEVKKELDRDLTEFERSIIKKKRTVETAIDEINFIKKNGGLNKEQGSEYLKLLDVIPKPSPKMIVDIQNGQKAADIIKRSTE